ncbi:MAG: hydrogenase formation protein HypD [Calditrichia bacterium]
MKYQEEYRDPQAVKALLEKIRHTATKTWTIMEVCGGQTHSFLKYGLDELIQQQVNLLHGPGCPVCVTPVELIEKAQRIASLPDVIFTSFGDMLRVPGQETDLLGIKARGGDVRILYNPMEALDLARNHPDKEVVFFGVGFETTAPAIAMTVYQAHRLGITNYSVLISHVLVPPAIELLLSSEGVHIDGFLAAGHVCTVMGYEEYIPIAEKYKIPIVVTGFEPIDLLEGIWYCVEMLEEGKFGVVNQYKRSVKKEGNRTAQDILKKVYRVSHQKWRGIGEIPNSGLTLAPEYEQYDADKKFALTEVRVEEPPECISGLILQGKKKPVDCPEFGRGCTPEHPKGATMVSNEGACSAYYKYKFKS